MASVVPCDRYANEGMLQKHHSGGWALCFAESCATDVGLDGRGLRTPATPRASLFG